MDLYFAGADQPMALAKFAELEVTHVAVGFYEWRERHAHRDLSGLPDNLHKCLIPGVARKTALDWDLFARDYVEFVEHNVDQLTQIFDIDAEACPLEVRRFVRERLNDIPGFVTFPVQDEHLPELAQRVEFIGINAQLARLVGPRDLRQLPAKRVGMNITAHTMLAEARFHSTVTYAWMMPRRFGDLYVWSGGRLRHYNGQEEVRRAVQQHRRAIEALGIDPESVLLDPKGAATTLAIKSMIAMAAHLSGRPRDREVSGINGGGADLVVLRGGGQSDDVPAGNEAISREWQLLPTISIDTRGNQPQVRSVPVSLRQCDSCYFANNCPEYQPHYTCAFGFPIELRTKAQIEAATQTLLELQFSRVHFAAFAEQIDGQGVNPKVGQEQDRFMRMLTQVAELRKNQAAEAQTGLVSKLLAKIEGTSPDELEGAEIIDGEEVDEDEERSAGGSGIWVAGQEEGSREEDRTKGRATQIGQTQGPETL